MDIFTYVGYITIDLTILWLIIRTGIAPALFRSWYFRIVRKLQIFRKSHVFHFTEIDTNLYLGNSPINYEDLNNLDKNGISGIVNLCEEWEIPLKKNDFLSNGRYHYLNLPTPDYGAPTDEQITCGIFFIDRLIRQNQKVLVFCHGGKGRSVLILMAYFIAKYQISPLESWKKIYNKNMNITKFFAYGFLSQQYRSIINYERFAKDLFLYDNVIKSEIPKKNE